MFDNIDTMLKQGLCPFELLEPYEDPICSSCMIFECQDNPINKR